MPRIADTARIVAALLLCALPGHVQAQGSAAKCTADPTFIGCYPAATSPVRSNVLLGSAVDAPRTFSIDAVLNLLLAADVSRALGYTAYNGTTNPAGYQTAAQVAAALPVAGTTAGTYAPGNDARIMGALPAATAATLYAPLASPALTGTPTVPTAAAGTNTAQVASTAFVQSTVAAGGGSGRQTIRVVTVAGAVTATPADGVIVVQKATGQATVVALEATPVTGHVVNVKDGKGDANTNNITVTPNTGTIDGAGSLVLSGNYGAGRVIYNGTEWNVLETFGAYSMPAYVPRSDFTGVTGLAAWYRPSDSSTVTASGGSVSQVNDISGNARHATRAASTKPTLANAVLNGMPVLAFDGVSQALEMDGLATALAGTTGPHHIFAVVRVTGSTSSAQYPAFFALQAASPATDYGDGIFAYFNSSTPGWGSARANGSTQSFIANNTSGTGVTNTWYIVEATWDGVGVAQVAVNGGVFQASSNTTSAAGAVTYAKGRMGVRWNGSAEVRAWPGQVAEIAVVSGSILSGTARTSRLNYLNQRYALGLPTF